MNQYYYIARVRIKHKENQERDYFGRGVADLLHGVRKHHSLNLAAKEMGMAYSKAWKIVRQAEAALGTTLLHRMHRNGSELTAEGERLLAAYEEAEKAAWDAVNRVMEKYYGDRGDEKNS